MRPPDVGLPEVDAWLPHGGEVEPAVKLTATRVIEALGTTDGNTTAADRLRGAGVDPALATDAGALVPPAAPAVVELVYPQYGGLTANRASVMAVVRQTWADGDQLRSRTVTADVRLQISGGTWQVRELRPVPPARPSSLRLGGRARKLRDHAAVDLPDAAVADLARGTVHDLVVDALLRLAEDFDFAVTALRSGHPEYVFGSGRTSNHTRGRAVDIWAIDGRPVVTMDGDDPMLRAFLDAARGAGSDEIGGPVDPDGPGGVHFTNRVHRDHVHIGFELN